MNTRLNRRHFLKTASLAGAGAPLLFSTASSAFGQKGPNDRLNLGFIGVGTQGRGLLGGFLSQPNTRVLAVCDVDTTRREHSKKTVDDFYTARTGTPSADCAPYKEFKELLARKDIDGVVIATPDHWHAYIAVAACAAGKDV